MGVLNDDSCTSTSFCEAVGAAQVNTTGDATNNLAERWNGSNWVAQTVPEPKGDTSAALNGDSCTTSSFCMAVGDGSSKAASSEIFTLEWNGTAWAVIPAQVPGCKDTTCTSPAPSFFNSVSCTSRSNCTAVGDWFSTTLQQQRTLVEHWNGTKWSTQSSPSRKSVNNYLNFVFCEVKVSSCAAVGETINSTGGEETLALQYSSLKWSYRSSPNPKGATASSLNGVACPSTSNCTAIGTTNATVFGEHWNGTSWSLLKLPEASTSGFGEGIACHGSTTCMGVGDGDLPPTYEGSPVSVYWNGTRWSSGTPPAPSGVQTSTLFAVSCPSSSVCIAVGRSLASSNVEHTLAEKWNGTGWSVTTTPYPRRAGLDTVTP